MSDTTTLLVTAAISAIAALAGALIGAWTVSRTSRAERSHRFRLEQLSDFYAPMSALRARIQVLSGFRVKVDAATDSSWREAVERGGTIPDGDRSAHLAVREEHDRQLRDDLVPLYRQMADLFTTKYHLVEPDTRAYYPLLVEFCEGWRRSLDRTLPGSVVVDVMPREDQLRPFYEHLLTTTDRLRTIIVSGE